MRINRRTMQIGIAISLVLLSGHSTWAQECSNKTTEGRYVIVGEGYVSFGPNAPLVPAKTLGIVTADANGVYTGDGIDNVGGQVFVSHIVGTQHLNADCTGSITYKSTSNGQPAPDISFTFVVSEHGNRIDGLSVTAGGMLSGVLRRLEEWRCDR